MYPSTITLTLDSNAFPSKRHRVGYLYHKKFIKVKYFLKAFWTFFAIYFIMIHLKIIERILRIYIFYALFLFRFLTQLPNVINGSQLYIYGSLTLKHIENAKKKINPQNPQRKHNTKTTKITQTQSHPNKILKS